jgi:hypothetical protein
MLTIKGSPEMRESGVEDGVTNHIISLLLSAFQIPIAKEIGESELSIFRHHKEK